MVPWWDCTQFIYVGGEESPLGPDRQSSAKVLKYVWYFGAMWLERREQRGWVLRKDEVREGTRNRWCSVFFFFFVVWVLNSGPPP
jgi:hypothetical protein